VAKRLAGLLSEPREGLPKKVFFHSLTAGFDVQTIVTDPNGFLSYIVGSPTVQIKTGFVGLRAPAIVRLDQREELLALPGVKEAYDRAGSLDLVVTAAGVRRRAGMLHRYYDQYSPATVEFLKAAVIWRFSLVAAALEPVSIEEAQADANADSCTGQRRFSTRRLPLVGMVQTCFS
jgi:hypothetical protein